MSPETPVTPDLREALEIGAKHTCSLTCHSVKRHGEEWYHTEDCRKLTAALSLLRSHFGNRTATLTWFNIGMRDEHLAFNEKE